MAGAGTSQRTQRSARPNSIGNDYRTGVLARLESILPTATSRNATLRDRILSIGYGQKQIVQPLADALEIDLDEYVRETQPHLTTAETARLINLGFSIGSHSHDHPLYAEIPLAEQLTQTRTSMELLTAKFGTRPKAFAFPHKDGGVEGEFFKTVFSESLLDISFGTSGLVSHFHPRNIERVGIEKTAAPVSRILARQFTRATYFRLRPSSSGHMSARTAARPSRSY